MSASGGIGINNIQHIIKMTHTQDEFIVKAMLEIEGITIKVIPTTLYIKVPPPNTMQYAVNLRPEDLTDKSIADLKVRIKVAQEGELTDYEE